MKHFNYVNHYAFSSYYFYIKNKFKKYYGVMLICLQYLNVLYYLYGIYLEISVCNK